MAGLTSSESTAKIIINRKADDLKLNVKSITCYGSAVSSGFLGTFPKI